MYLKVLPVKVKLMYLATYVYTVNTHLFIYTYMYTTLNSKSSEEKNIAGKI